MYAIRSYYAGTYKLYYYNPTTKQVEDCGDVMVDANGLATFTVSHCSDYFISSNVITAASSTTTTPVVVKPAAPAKNPKTGRTDSVASLFATAIVSITALAVLEKKRKLQIKK